ncbi:MAG: ABC transporter permease, partial [Acidobacteriota bacterium]
MGSLMLDLRSSLRGLRRRRGSTVAIIITLGLGIGAVSAIWSVVQAVLIAPLPYPQADRLTFVWSDLTEANYQRAPLSGPELDDLRRHSRAHDDFAAIWASSGTVIVDGRPDPLRIGMVTANFLGLLGVEPALGRWLAASDEGEGVPPRIVISGSLWQRRFGGDERLLGQALRIDGGWGVPGGLYTVVGVMPPGFEMWLPGDSSIPRTVDVWLPFQHDLPSSRRGSYYLRTVGRLADGATLEQAREELETLGREIESTHVEYAASGRAFYPESLKGDLNREVRPALLALLGGTLFVLLIACTNVAHLLLARAAERRREISLRAALGAGRRRIARQLVIESLLLAMTGAALGIALAHFALDALAAIRPAGLPRFDAVGIDLRVMGFVSTLAIGCGLTFGMVPVAESLRFDVARSLRSVNSGGDRRRQRTHGLLVASEMALAIVLLTGAGLLARTYVELQRVDPGFDSESVLTFQLSLPAERYPTPLDVAEL